MTVVLALLALVVHPVPATATLIVAVPTQDGLVVAADSREIVVIERKGELQTPTEYSDRKQKLQVLATTPPIVYGLTGDSDFVVVTSHGLIRDWLDRRPRELRSRPIVERALRDLRGAPLSVTTLRSVANALAARLDGFFSAHPDVVGPFRGKLLSNVVLYQVRGGARVTAAASVVADAQGHVTVSRVNFFTDGPDDAIRPRVLGAAEHALHVTRDTGWKLMPPAAVEIMNRVRRVSELATYEGIVVSQSIIRAAEARAKETSAGKSIAGIGGPIRGYLLTETSAISLDVYLNDPNIVK